MKCFMCLGKTKIKESREVDCITYRRHICTECGKVFYTKEIICQDKEATKAFYLATKDHPCHKKKRYSYTKNYKALYEQEKKKWSDSQASEQKLNCGENVTNSQE